MKVDVDYFDDATEEAQGISELQLIRRNSGGELVVLSIIFIKPISNPFDRKM